MLNFNDKVAIVCCSNPQSYSNKEKVQELVETLKVLGLSPVLSKYIFENSYGDGQERGKALMEFYLDDEIKAIFDISGGDIGNEVLEHLDYEVIKEKSKPFFGYSDLTTVISSIYAKTNNKSYLYQVRNLIYKDKEEQINNFRRSILEDGKELYQFKYSYVQGKSMEGIVVGGNIRCLLKLAGTEYIPDFKNKILLLEGYSGKVLQMKAFLTQLKHMGVFKDVKGIILGTFTEMEKENCEPRIEELVKSVVNNEDMPIIKTQEIGHGTNSKCVIVGEYYKL